MREGTTVGRTVGGGVADDEIVQIIDYQAYLTAMFPCILEGFYDSRPLLHHWVNSRVHEIVIYLRKYLHTFFHHSSVFMCALCIHPLVLHEQDV